MIEMIKNSLNACQLVCEDKKRFVVEGEVNVPDIKPDILNVVHVFADGFISGKEIVDNRVKVEGVMDVYFVYLAEDEEGATRSIMYPLRFTEYLEAPGVGDASMIDLDCTVSSVDTKVLSNRKVSIKVNAFLHMKVLNALCFDVMSGVTSDSHFELKKESEMLNTLLMQKTDVATLNETVLIDNGSPMGEILKASIRLVGSDVKASYNKVLTKAEAVVTIVYVGDDENSAIQSFETRIPVMGFMDVDGLDDQKQILLSSKVQSFSVKPIYQEMKATSFLVEGLVEFTASIYQVQEVELLKDIYAIDQELMVKEGDIKVLDNVFSSVETMSISQSLLIPDLDRIRILEIEVKPSMTSVDVLEGKISLEGELQFDILYARLDKKMMETKKMELPFRQVVKMEGVKSTMTPELVMKVQEVHYQVAGQNELQLEVKLCLSVSQCENKTLKFVNAVEKVEKERFNLPSLVIYYVKGGDSLWSIAKAFHTTVDDIKAVNDLKEDTIYPGEQLFIPRYQFVKETSMM